MESRWFNIVVVVFWVTTMSWLFVAKILPPLRKGEPPNYRSVLAAQQAEAGPVRWRILWNNHAAGSATHRLVRLRTGEIEIHSDVQFDRLPLHDLLPALLLGQIKEALGGDDFPMVHCTSRLNISVLGRLSEFRSHVWIGDSRAISLVGGVEGTRLELTVKLGNAPPLNTSIHLPSDALVSDALSPQSYLPGLRINQEWTVPVINPLRPDSAMQVLQASVPRDEWIIWDGQPVEARVVEYRADAGSGLESDHHPPATLWVGSNGMVLKQELRILGAAVTFERLPDENTSRAAAQQVQTTDAPAQANGEQPTDEAP